MKRSDECTPPGKPALLNHIHAEMSNGKCVTVLKSQTPDAPRHGWKHSSGAQRVSESAYLTDGGPYRAEDLFAISKSSLGTDGWAVNTTFWQKWGCGVGWVLIQQPINDEIRRRWWAGGRGSVKLSFLLVSCGFTTPAEGEMTRCKCR